MTDDETRASGTAVLVCQGRAVAHGTVAPSRFHDPAAMLLLREPERAAVERARSGEAPPAAAERMEYELLRATAEVVVPRTVAIDDALAARHNPQVVILGAGLDGRAWRMDALSGVDVFEVDHPATQRDKQDRARELQPVTGSLRFVPVDFTADDLGGALATSGHVETAPTTWVWEGVVPYLREADVVKTLQVVTRRSAPGGRVIVNYQAPSMTAALGRLALRAASAAAPSLRTFTREPRRSAWAPAKLAKLLAGLGWSVDRDDDLLALAESIPSPTEHARSLRSGRVVVADRAGR